MTALPADIPVFDTDGALSREYLLHRGHCCENGCRNCPYGFVRPARPEPPSLDLLRGSCLLPEREPRRIVSLCPSNTEILDALGLLDRTVGLDDWSDWPPAARDLPRVGPDQDVDIDRVAALRPDLVLASLSVPGMERNVARLQERGIPHLTLDPHGIDDIWENLRRVGAVCGVPGRAEAVVAGLQARIHRVRESVAGAACRPRLYWEWWPKPLFAPGGRNWLTPLSALAGCVSITGDSDTDSVCPSGRQVIDAQPDWILLAWTGVAAAKVRPDVVLRRPGWDVIPAVRDGRIQVMEEGLYCRPSPRLIDGLERLTERVWGCGQF